MVAQRAHQNRARPKKGQVLSYKGFYKDFDAEANKEEYDVTRKDSPGEVQKYLGRVETEFKVRLFKRRILSLFLLGQVSCCEVCLQKLAVNGRAPQQAQCKRWASLNLFLPAMRSDH